MEQFIFDPKNRLTDPDGNDLITLTGEEHFHLSRVLRGKVGEKILATDGKGTTCLCLIKRVEKDKSICGVSEEYHGLNLSRRNFCIGIASLKPISKLEIAIEKCTELGAAGFVVFCAERSERMNLRTERMAGIIKSAVKQSLQSTVPGLEILKNLEDIASASRNYEIKIVLHEKSTNMVSKYLASFKENTSAIALIGPEGGFSEKEIEFLTTRGFYDVSVGNPRLRSETAAMKISALLAEY